MSRHLEEGEGKRSTGIMSRRNFIATAGLVAAGGALAGGAMANVTGTKEAPGTPPPLPWPWVKLDPLEAGKRAFRTYHEKGG